MDKHEGANAAFSNSSMSTAGVNKLLALRLGRSTPTREPRYQLVGPYSRSGRFGAEKRIVLSPEFEFGSSRYETKLIPDAV